ncbi:hypothetical protein TVAG_099760 [Trichomonas vaginalis G3]|uniref:Uncharacterized protein n=1 Tax=Trichomonas vaginalis (strain ATCC PRA-98 / G3) TaxID=412133 RepID=A2EK43_TRIV3|nr:hypothetical protein TVAGG3_0838130 [Trichomonas vaginalis G3]EAY06936.1 hypothetical protein TVAG_099760 [Trichomonas vaginalis G3]KAI5499087.1 hypothetical protein TVAGG3_0838130 [Trichomonas vaginalis G3]|eukprot:XP_001319159.1 hypothetical protein [Trichomonas vaginalis G3]
MNYIYLPPVLEIVECEFKDISVIADSGSAINFDHPMYEFLSYDPKIKIDSCLFLNCVSDSCPGAVRINYTHAQVSINKMCSLNCGGNYYTIFCILTNSSAHINASTIFSTHDTITQYERYASGINPLPKYIGNYSISFLNGLNHTHGKYFTAPHDGLGVNVSYSHFENLSSLSFLGIDNSNILKCNFIEVTCDITYGINLNYIFYECVFDKTNIIDNFEYRFKSPIEKINETFINCYIKKYNETFDGKIISLDLYLNNKCNFPIDRKDRTLLIISLVVASATLLILSSVLITFFIYRRKQNVIDARHTLEQNLLNDFG